jgi:hypothetical protein
MSNLHPIFQAICEAHFGDVARTPAVKCDTCKALIPTDDVADCTVHVGGPEDRDSIHLCRTCFDVHEAEMEATMRRYKAEYDIAPLSERDPAEYRRQMIDAGRGHLVREE